MRKIHNSVLHNVLISIFFFFWHTLSEHVCVIRNRFLVYFVWFSTWYIFIVFRTNVAITKGHEEDVGTKTSFYCFGMKTLSNSIYYLRDKGFTEPPWNRNIRYIFLPEDDWAYHYIHAALTNGTLPKGCNERYAKRCVDLI